MRFTVQVYTDFQANEAIAALASVLGPGDGLQVNSGNSPGSTVRVEFLNAVGRKLRRAFPDVVMECMTASHLHYEAMCDGADPDIFSLYECNYEPDARSPEFRWDHARMVDVVAEQRAIAARYGRTPALMVSGQPVFRRDRRSDPWNLPVLFTGMAHGNVQLQHVAKEGQGSFMRYCDVVWSSQALRETVEVQVSVHANEERLTNTIDEADAISLLRELYRKMPDARIDLFPSRSAIPAIANVIRAVRG